MDYIIADRTIIPENEQRYYTEKVVYLPHSYLPPGDPRAPVGCRQTRAEHGLPDQAFVFCAFNAHWKITPDVFDIWMRLLAAKEESVLWLSSATQAVTGNLVSRAAEHGIARERLVFAPRMAQLKDHLARHLLADLFLDTLPYNAHTTALDALWAGLPVLTCRGESFAGRVAAGMLASLQLSELVTTDLRGYQSRALQLANDPNLLGQLRCRLDTQRNAHPLFDAGSFCRNLESAFVAMQICTQHGDGPESSEVGALR